MAYEEIRLVKPSLGLKDKALEYRQEHFDFGEQIINGSELFDKIASYEEWFKKVIANASAETVVFSIVIVLSFLIVCGLPLGELTMGGFISLWFSDNTTEIICIVMAIYLSFNTVMNFISKSKKEKYVMMPLSLISAVCF